MHYLVSSAGLKEIEGGFAGDEILDWHEWMLEHVLVLGLDDDGHELLGARDSIPLALDGSTTSNVPDQLYIDRTGRLTVVELKSGTAGPRELAQLLAYAEHHRPLPWGELEAAFRLTTHAKTLETRREEANQTLNLLADDSSEPMPARPPGTLRQPYTTKPSPGLRAIAIERWKPEPIFALEAAPPRLIIAARDFDDSVLDAADEMRERGVDIRLARCALLRAHGALALRWDWVPLQEPKKRGVSAPEHGPTYRWSDVLCEAMACFAEDARLKDRLVLNGFAEGMQKLLVSASLKDHWPVRLYLRVEVGSRRESDGVTLWTSLPHVWCESGERGTWNKKLRDALLSLDGEPSGDEWSWSFEWPRQRRLFIEKAVHVADALSDVLGSPAG